MKHRHTHSWKNRPTKNSNTDLVISIGIFKMGVPDFITVGFNPCKPMLVPIRINGHRRQALLDTGSDFNMVTEKMLKSCQIPNTSIDRRIVKTCYPVGDKKLSCHGSVTLSFTMLGQKFEEAFSVCQIDNLEIILGKPFLNKNPSCISFNTCTLLVKSAFTQHTNTDSLQNTSKKEESEQNTEGLKFEDDKRMKERQEAAKLRIPEQMIFPFNNEGYVEVPIQINNHTLWAQLDTGSTACAIAQWILDECKIPNTVNTLRAKPITLWGGKKGMSQGTIFLSFSINGHQFQEEFTVIPNSFSGVILGTPFLLHNNAVLDFSTNKVYVNANGQEDDSENVDNYDDAQEKSCTICQKTNHLAKDCFYRNQLFYSRLNKKRKHKKHVKQLVSLLNSNKNSRNEG